MPKTVTWKDASFTLMEIGIRLFLAAIYHILAQVPPLETGLTEADLARCHKPLVPTIMPMGFLLRTFVYAPLITYIFLAFIKKDKCELGKLCTIMSFSVLVSLLITQVIKIMVARPRPNYIAKCFPDGKIPRDLKCSADSSVAKDARKSFPSGHTSLVFSAMTVLTLALDFMLSYDHPFMISIGMTLLLKLFPILIATMVALSRLSDYSHHLEDIMAGSIIGIASAVFSHRAYRGIGSRKLNQKERGKIRKLEKLLAMRLSQNTANEGEEEEERTVATTQQ